MSRSRQNSFFSERDEDFFDEMNDNRTKLQMIQYYQPCIEDYQSYYSDTLKDSILAAKQAINNIMKRTEEVLYEKYLQSRKDSYAIAQTLLQCELSLNLALKIPDSDHLLDNSIQIHQLDDQEPQKPVPETWIRSKISVEHPHELQKYNEEDFIDKHDKHSQSEQTSLTHRKTHFKRKEDAFKQDIPQPKNMEPPQEVDEFVERLRVIKQLESKRKEEKEEQEKKEKQKNPQELKKEMKNVKYTYDFDGKIINTKSIKIDKLPPSNYQINYNFSTQEVDKNKIKKQKAQLEEQQKQQQLAQQQLQQQQQQQQKGKGSFLQLPPPPNNNNNRDDVGLGINNKQIVSKNPFSYDDFNPSQGVTLYFDQRVKEGPRNKETFDNLANLDQRLKMKEEPLQITRTEYKRLTENGNLNMASTIKNMQDQIAHQHGFLGRNASSGAINAMLTNRSSSINDNQPSGIKRLDTMKLNSPTQQQMNNNNNNILDQQSIIKTNKQSYFLGALNNQHITSKGQKNDDFTLSLDNHSKSKITIKSPQLIQSIINNTDGELNLFSERPGQGQNDKNGSTLKLPGINDKLNQNSILLKSPVDDFNQSIIKGSADWGKGNRGVGNLYSGKPIHKPDQKVYRTTLNQYYKLPRERDWGQSFKLSKSTKHLNKPNLTEQSHSIQPETEFRGTFYTYNSKFSETLRSFRS